MLTPEVVCYLETYPTISSDDKDVYPNFVVMESLELLYYGEQFEDVLMNVQSQIERANDWRVYIRIRLLF